MTAPACDRRQERRSTVFSFNGCRQSVKHQAHGRREQDEADQPLVPIAWQCHCAAAEREWHGSDREGRQQGNREIPGTSEANHGDGCDDEIQHERRWPHHLRRYAQERHLREITRRSACPTDEYNMATAKNAIVKDVAPIYRTWVARCGSTDRENDPARHARMTLWSDIPRAPSRFC